ncbi:MAG: DUF4157 domain-containing protein [Myxococcales bacterium]|nr:DUF4157 domain-containing protein [Myxococcales bacterium]
MRRGRRPAARAYTEGNSVHGAGTVRSGSQAGRELIGHELAHVVQQRRGRVAATKPGSRHRHQ